jgi:hypothetical protein
MPVDLQRAERALRAAHEAGDVEAAQKIARGIREMRGGSLRSLDLEREQDLRQLPAPDDRSPLARYALQPMEYVADAITGGAEAMVTGADRMAMRYIPPIAGAIIGAPAGLPGMILGAGAGNVAGAGLERRFYPDPDAPPRAPDAPPQMLEDFREGALMGAAGAAAGRGLGVAEAAARSRARAGGTIPEATMARGEEIARQAQYGVSDPRSVLTKVLAEVGKATGAAGATGAGGGLLAEALIPGSGYLAGALGGASAFTITSILRLPALSRNLLANNPRFAKWALSSGPSAPTAGAGAVAGTAAVGTGTFGVEQMRDLIDIMMTEGPEVANAIKEFVDQFALIGREQREGTP